MNEKSQAQRRPQFLSQLLSLRLWEMWNKCKLAVLAHLQNLEGYWSETSTSHERSVFPCKNVIFQQNKLQSL